MLPSQDRSKQAQVYNSEITCSGPDQEQREIELKNSEMLPLSTAQLGFWSKFWELQVICLS